jgi:hypothetical protein
VQLFDGVFDWLRLLRRRVRLLAVLDGLACALALATLFVAGAIAEDYLLEPGRSTRTFVLAGLTICGLILLVWQVFARLVAPLGDVSLAAWIEQKRPELADRLLTAVELGNQPHPFSRALTAQSAAEAAQLLGQLQLAKLVPRRPVLRHVAVALAMFAGLATFTCLAPVVAQTWWRRQILLADERYPRRTRLVVLGFDGSDKKAAKGSDFELTVAADPTGVVPEYVEVRYRVGRSGALRRGRMTVLANGHFRFVFSDLLEPIELQVRGGDHTSDWLSLTPVDAPALSAVRLTIDPPAYLNRKPTTIDYAGGAIALPDGAAIAIELRGTRSLQWLHCRCNGVELPVARHDVSTFSTDLCLEQNLTVEISFADLDGIGPREPVRVELRAVVDKPPTLRATAYQVGRSVTRMASLPVRIAAEDDYGIERLRFVGTAAERSVDRPIPIAAADTSRVDRQELFSVADWKLEPGKQLSLAVEAADGDTRRGPHVTRSEAMQFEIVTAEDLLVGVAGRELQLRQRFEQVIRELEDARQTVATLGTSNSASPQEPTSIDRLRLERTIQDLQRSQTETAGVADAYRDLVAELRWNKIANSALLARMEQGVIEPLDGIVQGPFPAVADRLRGLRNRAESFAQLRAECTESLDRLLAACRAVLNAMLKLESFNEAVAILRGIITDEESLGQRIKEERRKQLLELLK